MIYKRLAGFDAKAVRRGAWTTHNHDKTAYYLTLPRERDTGLNIPDLVAFGNTATFCTQMYEAGIMTSFIGAGVNDGGWGDLLIAPSRFYLIKVHAGKGQKHSLLNSVMADYWYKKLDDFLYFGEPRF